MNNVAKLLDTKAQIEQTRKLLDILTERYEGLKDSVIHEIGEDKSLEYKGALLSIVTTNSVKVVDQKLVTTWLKTHKYKIEDFQKLDLIKVKPILTSAIYTQGKAIKGVETEMGKQTLRVTYKS